MLVARLMEPGRFVTEDGRELPPPGNGEVQIRVMRVGICGSDISAFYGRHPYIHCPIVLGHEFAGLIEKVGAGVTALELGMRCTVIPHLICGECPACREGSYNLCHDLKCIGAQADGAFTQYVNVPAQMAIPVPDSVSIEDAALVEPAAVGYHAARRGSPRFEDAVVVFGAGPIGVFTMQCVKALGAGRVLIVDKDSDRLSLAGALGADGTIDVSTESVDSGLVRLADGAERVDLFMDCVGFGGEALDEIVRIARRGTRVVVAGVLESGCRVPHLPDFVEHELALIGSTMYVPQDFRDVLGLLATGKVRTDGMITHTAPLSRVEDVYRMIDARREKFFKIMLTVDGQASHARC